MQEIRKITYIDFLGNEYDGEENKTLAFEEENEKLSDVAKLVMFACGKHSTNCTRMSLNGTTQFCPFLCSDNVCIFSKKFDNSEHELPIEWEFKNNSRFENEELIEEMFN